MRTTTTTTTPDGTTTTTTTTTQAERVGTREPSELPCYKARHARFKRSKIGRDLRRFVRMAREVSDFGHALAARLPRAEVLDDFNLDDGESADNMADSITGGLWAFDIAFSLVDSELPFNTDGTPRRRPADKAKAKKRKPTPTPAGIPVVGVLDCRTQAEREADEAAGKTWEDVAAEVLAGTAEPLAPARKPHNRIKAIA